MPDNIPKLLINHEVLQHTYLSDDEDFCSSSEEEEEVESSLENIEIKKSKSEHNLAHEQDVTIMKSMSLIKNRLLKGVSLGNLKFPFHSPASTSAESPSVIKKSKSSSLLIEIEKDEEKRKLLGDGFDSEESDCFMESKENWNVDISNINYFHNNSQMRDDHQHMRNSMSPITKSTQRMPKSMQVGSLINAL